MEKPVGNGFHTDAYIHPVHTCVKFELQVEIWGTHFTHVPKYWLSPALVDKCVRVEQIPVKIIALTTRIS